MFRKIRGVNYLADYIIPIKAIIILIVTILIRILVGFLEISDFMY